MVDRHLAKRIAAQQVGTAVADVELRSALCLQCARRRALFFCPFPGNGYRRPPWCTRPGWLPPPPVATRGRWSRWTRHAQLRSPAAPRSGRLSVAMRLATSPPAGAALCHRTPRKDADDRRRRNCPGYYGERGRCRSVPLPRCRDLRPHLAPYTSTAAANPRLAHTAGKTSAGLTARGYRTSGGESAEQEAEPPPPVPAR